MTDNATARLLDCGYCYEEHGEEVHPHPECPIGRPAVSVPASAPTNRAAIEAAALRKAADEYDAMADRNEAEERAAHGEVSHDGRLQDEAVRDVASGLRDMADEIVAASGSGRAADETQAERRCRLCDEPITGTGVTHFGAPDGPHFHVDREACRIAGGLPPKTAGEA
ncbi:hypothetical protein [Streptomyces aureus]